MRPDQAAASCVIMCAFRGGARWALLMLPILASLILMGAGAAHANTPNIAATPLNAQSLGCPSCDVMNAILEGAFRLTDDFTTLITESLQGLVTAVLGIWILIQVGKLLFPLGPLDRVPNLLGTVTGTVLLAVAVLFVLMSADIYKKYLLHPIMAVSINTSNLILDQALTVSGTAPSGRVPTLATVSSADNPGDFEREAKQALIDHIKTVHESLQKGLCMGIDATGMGICMERNPVKGIAMKIGADIAMNIAVRAGICGAGTAAAIVAGGVTLNPVVVAGGVAVTGVCALISMKNSATDQERGKDFMDTIGQMIVIVSIIIIYGLVWLKYPLYVLDIVIKWSVLSIFWPLMAAALLLPTTRPSAFSALKGLGHAGLTLVFMAAVIGTSLSVIDQMWVDIGTNFALKTQTLGENDYWLAVITGLIMLYVMKECPRMAGALIDSSMDLRVSEGLWNKMKDAIWMAADVVTAGKAGRFKRILNIR